MDAAASLLHLARRSWFVVA